MYTQAYSLGSKSKTPLLDHCKVYVLAEKYDVPELKNLAKSKYEKSISNDWDNDWDDDDFIQSLRLMYDETPKSDRQMKDVAIPVACRQKERLLCYEPFTTLMEDFGEIGVDMMKEELSWRTRQPIPNFPFLSQYLPFAGPNLKTSSTIPPLRTTRYSSGLSSTRDLRFGSRPNVSSTTTSTQKKAVAVNTGPSIPSITVVNGVVTTSSLPNHYFTSPAGLGPTPGLVCPNCNSIYNTWRFLNGKNTYKCHDCDTVF
jgi:hypothetical protein